MLAGGYQVFVFGWIMVGFTFCLVLIRLFARRRLLLNQHSARRNLALTIATECFVFFAWISFAFDIAVENVLLSLGVFDPEFLFYTTPTAPANVTLGLKIFYIQGVTYLNCLYAVKAAILCAYFKLFSEEAVRSKRLLRATVAFVAAGWLSQFCMSAFWCMPVRRNWSPDSPDFCSSQASSAMYFASIVPHILSDILIYTLPLPLILTSLRLSPAMITTHEKVKLALTFSLGSFCILFAVCITVICIERVESPIVVTFMVLEQSNAIMVVCFPHCFNVLFGGQSRMSLQENTLAKTTDVVEIDNKTKSCAWKETEGNLGTVEVGVGRGRGCGRGFKMLVEGTGTAPVGSCSYNSSERII